MSEQCYVEFDAWIIDQAYEQAKMALGREPTIEEIEEEVEALKDRYM